MHSQKTRSNSNMNSFTEAACEAHHGPNLAKIPQSKPLPGQVANSGGGFCFKVTDETYARRLCIMGTDKPTYYASARDLSTQAATFANKMVTEGKGMLLLNTLIDVHKTGSAPKMNFTLALLGFLTRCNDHVVRKAAQSATIWLLRTNSQLYSWLNYHMKSGYGKGFGRGPKTVISLRYHNPLAIEQVPRHVMEADPRKYWMGMSAKNMAYQFTKYSQRGGLSMSDLMSLIHFKPTKAKRPKTVRELGPGGKPVYKEVAGTGGTTPDYVEWPLSKQVVLTYVKKGLADAVHNALVTVDATSVKVPKAELLALTAEQFDSHVELLGASVKEVLTYLWAVDVVKTEGVDVTKALSLIAQHNLPREVLATSLLRERSVWLSLLLKDVTADEVVINMPITALIRNLGAMSARNLFDTSAGSAADRALTVKVIDAICAHLTNKNVLVRGRVHPLQCVAALRTYRTGVAVKGSSRWPVCQKIVRALEQAVQLSYHTIKATGLETLMVADVSPSMRGPSSVADGMTSAEACAIECHTRLCAERRSEHGGRTIVGTFSTGSRIVYDSDIKGSAFTLNPKMDEHIDKVIRRVGAVAKPKSSYGYGYGYGSSYSYSYGSYGNSTPPPTCNMFDPLATTSDAMWKEMEKTPWQSTDCARPVLMAMAMHDAAVASPEVIVVFTDNETNCGSIHATAAMREYRKRVPHAKLVVVAATATNFSIADPEDPGMLDVAGFDVGASNVIYDFVTEGETRGLVAQAKAADASESK